MSRSLLTVILYSAAKADALKAASETPNNAAREVVATLLVPRRIRILPDVFVRKLPRAVVPTAHARGASNRTLHGRCPIGKGWIARPSVAKCSATPPRLHPYVELLG